MKGNVTQSDCMWPHVLCSPWNSPGQNTGVRSLSFLQGVFATQGSNPGLPHCRRILYQLGHKGSPSEVKCKLRPTLCNPMDYAIHGILQARILEWVSFPLSRGSSQPRDQTQVSRIASGFFIGWATREALKDKSSTKISLFSHIQWLTCLYLSLKIYVGQHFLS